MTTYPHTLKVTMIVNGAHSLTQRIPVPLTPYKHTDIRLYADRSRPHICPIKVVISKCKSIPKKRTYRLGDTGMILVTRMVYEYNENGSYTPKCLYADNTSVETLQ